MPWKILTDKLAEPTAKPGTNANAVGVCGPSGAKINEAALIHKFKMYDDDGELYYEGVSSDCDSEEAFGPLWDFGEPNAGCTRIDYFNEKTGEWETL